VPSHPVLSLLFCLIQSLVRPLDELFETLSSVVQGIAAGDGHCSQRLVFVHHRKAAYFLYQGLCKQQQFLLLCFGEKDGKLIAAIAADTDGDIEVAEHKIGKLGEHRIAGVVAIGIVELLEVVHIEEDDTQ